MLRFCDLTDDIELRIREVGSKFVLTDRLRAPRMVEVVSRLDFVREVFVIGDTAVSGCTPFEDLFQDPGDGIASVYFSHFITRSCLKSARYERQICI